ncbi:protein mono-ADP-ribosyltransferase PARP3-like [Penaeus monodon]|uniref:protein mono-ADP-ribosyltransferase PARP3-like n=1 Tax=Penaeus monodon TaxID=6687 RepID=UPI0018A7DA48|nr:protein mono-ADP-ribosyltransferase PARP3-like [Penaeus monodon]
MARRRRRRRGQGQGAVKRKSDDGAAAKRRQERLINARIYQFFFDALDAAADDLARRKRAVDRVVATSYPEAVVYENYSCSLRQTSRDQNPKFHVMQVIESKGCSFFFARWGRVGEEGKWKIEPKATVDDAIEMFEKMFRVKTRNDWDDKDDFETFPSRYAVFEES